MHLHLLLWLKGAPSAEKMKELLSQATFQERIIRFISVNIQEHHECLNETQNQHENSVNNKSPSYSRPIDPMSPTYQQDHDQLQLELVCSVQMHKCGPGCMVVHKGGVHKEQKRCHQLTTAKLYRAHAV